MPRLTKLAWTTAIIAFLTVAANVFTAVRTGPILVLPLTLIPLCAGIGILRRKVWSAYGYALFAGAQLVLTSVVLARGRSGLEGKLEGIAAIVLALGIGLLFFFAGRSLARAGATRGRAYPWIVLAAVVILPFVFFEAFVIPTGAMENTLLVGDRIAVRLVPPVTPARGELVVLAYPVDHRQTFVKRIIGMPGDRIRLVHKAVYRNGARLDEPYVVHKTDYEDAYRDNFPTAPNTPLYPQAQEMLEKNVVNGEVVVPPGRYFVLGDNRDQSLDSRYWGFAADSELIGKPVFIYDSQEETTDDLTRPASAPRPGRTRWDRIFKVLR